MRPERAAYPALTNRTSSLEHQRACRKATSAARKVPCDATLRSRARTTVVLPSLACKMRQPHKSTVVGTLRVNSLAGSMVQLHHFHHLRTSNGLSPVFGAGSRPLLQRLISWPVGCRTGRRCDRQARRLAWPVGRCQNVADFVV